MPSIGDSIRKICYGAKMRKTAISEAEKDLDEMKSLIEKKKKKADKFKQMEGKTDSYIQKLKSSGKKKEYTGFESPDEASKEENPQ